MRLFGMAKNSVNKITSNLTSLDSQPLSKASLLIIIFLDIFVLTSLFDGLERHTAQLSSPEDEVPYVCREIVIEAQWDPSNRMEKLSDIVLSYYNRYTRGDEQRKRSYPICAPYLDALDEIKSDHILPALFQERRQLKEEADHLQRQLDAVKGAYDTALLEGMADREQGRPDVEQIKREVQTKTDALDNMRGHLAEKEAAIEAHENVKSLWDLLQARRPSDREKLIAELRRLNFWYPVKRLGMQMIFLLPIFAIFYLWNNASIKRNRGVQTLVSAHLLAITFIPILFTVIETVYDIIPKILLKKLIDLLSSLKLIALWHYLIIGAAVGASLFLIYIFQKKLFSRDKLMERRIAKGLCQQCGKHLPLAASACPFCGFAQFKPCGACRQATPVFGKYCKHCGAAQ